MAMDPMYTDCLQELEQVKQQRDQLREALEDAVQLQGTHYGDGMGLHMAIIRWVEKARAALNATEEA